MPRAVQLFVLLAWAEIIKSSRHFESCVHIFFVRGTASSPRVCKTIGKLTRYNKNVRWRDVNIHEAV